MRIIGYDNHRVAFRSELDHGVDPLGLPRAHGYATARPLAARRAPDGEFELDLAVTPAPPAEPARPEPAQQDARPEQIAGPPVVRRRVAAYGLITSTRGLLATEFSHLTGVPGQWGLAGGGIEDDEQPSAAVAREAYEETGQRVDVAELIAVGSGRRLGVTRQGELEDLHTVRLIYRGSCPDPIDPVIHDLDGTTSAARWLPLDRWTDVPWAPRWAALIRSVLAPVRSHR
ncbi:NUDIX hydrolase [Microlunatus speluncae]|uniref:NUDIX hydrolase n=1 Tax=Microlunatus speluncae TaxID=2594267 RepID=UPI00126687B2|nr:NUDIX domain-containing protein [Microlunatus speluncae]